MTYPSGSVREESTPVSEGLRLDFARLALGRRHIAHRERILDILEDGEIRDQMEALKDQADVEIADARAFARLQRVRRAAGPGHVGG